MRSISLWPLSLLPILLLITIVAFPVVYSATLLSLERTFPLNHSFELHHLISLDRRRHARLLHGGFFGGVVDFPVQGSSDPYLAGVDASSNPTLYFTKVKLGSPPREFNVQIDTGSDVLWVSCSSCSNCPQSSDLGIQLSFFDAASSSTSGAVLCSDPNCKVGFQTATTRCSPQSNQCSYEFHYGDQSGTSGYYVSDILYFDAIWGQSLITNSSAHIVFGCSTYQSGDLSRTEKAVDGIFGFGRGDLSVISQLASQGITPQVFSHCLKGAGVGGGTLVLGEIMEPGIVYSPLVPSLSHYNLDLQSIAVNGQSLPIDPAVFATSDNHGTIVDTGTTLAYLVKEAFDPLLSAVTTAVSQSASPTSYKGYHCFLVSSSISDIFPLISFNFDGGASMVLKPEEYLMQNGYYDPGTWCFGFISSPDISILGDLVLKDKIFVYDLAHQRVGWANYDCSRSVNVSVISSKDFINAGRLSGSNSLKPDIFLKPLSLGFVTLLSYMFIILS